MTVALAYTPHVRSTRVDYKASRIEFKVVTGPGLDHVSTMFNKATEKDDYENILGRLRDFKGMAILFSAGPATKVLIRQLFILARSNVWILAKRKIKSFSLSRMSRGEKQNLSGKRLKGRVRSLSGGQF